MLPPTHRKPWAPEVSIRYNNAFDRPTYLPPRWLAHVQAEGKPYFHRDGELTAVTESWIHTPDIANEAEKWIDFITGKVKEKNMNLATVELYIRIDEDMDCLYYLVNKNTQTLFWLDDYDTEQLGLAPAASPSHLSMTLLAPLLIDTHHC
jgi:hypothetical protein